MTSFLYYKLTGVGWGEFTISNREHYVEFEFSYLRDPLTDLLNSLLLLLKKEVQSAIVVFPEEPGEHSMLLTLLSENNLQIEVYWSEEWENISHPYNLLKSKKKIYTDTDTLLNFSRITTNTIQGLLDKHGTTGYKEKWVEYDFPEKLLSELKIILKQ